MSTIKVDTIKNTSNVEVFTAKAWVNFDGTTNTGGTCTIRASGNVTSVTDIATGIYIVNFTTSMPDTSYSTLVTCQQAEFAAMQSPTTSSVYVYCVRRTDTLTRSDNALMNVAVFR